MKQVLVCGALLTLLLATAAPSYADIARPKTSPSPAQEARTVLHTRLTIAPDSNSSEARLQISQEELQSLRNALAGIQVSPPTWGQRIAHSSMRTIMAGFFLFLSVSFAGVWLARSGQRRNQRAIGAAILGVAVISAAAIIAQANAGPPGYVNWSGLPKALSEGHVTAGGLDIEIVPGDEGLKLIVPIRKGKFSNIKGEGHE